MKSWGNVGLTPQILTPRHYMEVSGRIYHRVLNKNHIKSTLTQNLLIYGVLYPLVLDFVRSRAWV